MRIAVLSDLHLGYASDSELENDSFDNAEEAMQKALEADLIIITGDIFDSRIPKTSTWARAIKLLVKPLLKPPTGVKLVYSSKELKEISKRTLQHIPIVALHGTHERRGKDETNVIETLDHAGILIHLDCDTMVFEKDNVKVAIHGMSGVPERYAADILNKWNPKPVDGCFNIILLHQSIEPYIYSPLEPPSLNTSNLPRGFNLIIDGHIHLSGQDRTNSGVIIFPGSTIVTQLEKNAAGADKGFFLLNVNSSCEFTFIPLQTNRRFFYEEVGTGREEIENRIRNILSKNLNKPPLIKMRVVGKEAEYIEQELREMVKKYSGEVLLRFSKELESPEIEKKIKFLRNLREQKMSVEEIGMQLLRKSLEQMNFDSVFDYDQTFRLLSEGDIERTFNILVGDQTTLTQVLKKGGFGKWMN